MAISPESSSFCSAQAPRMYVTRLRSRAPRSDSRAARLKSADRGGMSSAVKASSSVDLPAPERPTNRNPRSAFGISCGPLKVTQLNTCRRRIRYCSRVDSEVMARVLVFTLFALRQFVRSEEHTSELQSPDHLVCRLLLEKKKSISLKLCAG